MDRQIFFLHHTLNYQQSILPLDDYKCERGYQTDALISGDQFWADCDIGGYELSLSRYHSVSDTDRNGSLNGNFTHDY